MGLRLTFEIELRSDYHVGAGHGLAGLADSALHRDADGLPVLRGTTLTGLLRDGLRRLLQLQPLRQHYTTCQGDGSEKYCGENDPDQPDCPVCRILGSPRTPRRWRTSSARPAGFPEVITGGWAAGETGGLIAPHVRVNPRTRRAANRQLFFREEGDARLRFRFTVTCNAADNAVVEEATWLIAAARNVRNLGASRRRGRGECRIHLLDEGTSGMGLPALDSLPAGEHRYEGWFLERFARRQMARQIPPPQPPRRADFAPAQMEGNRRLLVIARLEEPLLVTGQAEAGNEFLSLDYIPGTALRGALANRVAARCRLEEGPDDPVYASFVRLFLRDGLIFSPLYPAERDERTLYPALPAPKDLHSCELYNGFAGKEDSPRHGVRSLALSDEITPLCPRCHPAVPPDSSDTAGGFRRQKPLGGFFSLRSTPVAVHPEHQAEMHVRIEPGTGRAAAGNLFGFDALAAGQYFIGELVCPRAADWVDLCNLAGLDIPADGGVVTLHLGKASRRGYGRVTLWIGPPQAPGSPWCPVPLEERVVDAQGPLVLTLLTDTIVADSWGRCQAGFDAAWLEKELNPKKEGDSQEESVCVQVKRAFCATRMVDSFNTHLGLPRWRDIALAAGSTVGLELISQVPLATLQEKLRQAEENGIGLRRGEGFGRIVFNHPWNDPGYAGWGPLAAGGIFLPEPLAPVAGSEDHRLHIETRLRQEWAEFLAADRERYQGDRPDPFRYAEWTSLARLLRTTPINTATDATELLGRMGHAAALLPEKERGELRVREADKAGTNFFRSPRGKGRAGQEALQRLVEKLTELVDDHVTKLAGAEQAAARQRCWQIGREMLADRIAAVAREEADDE